MPINWLHQLPSITLTNDQNEDTLPSPALSPLSPDTPAGGVAAKWQTHTSIDESVTVSRIDPEKKGMQSTCRAPVDVTQMSEPARFSPARLRKIRSNNGSNASAAIAAAAMSSGSSNTRDFRVLSGADQHDMHAQHAIDPLSSHIIKRTSASPLAVSQPQQQQQQQQHVQKPSSRRSSHSSEKTTPSMLTDDARSRSRSRSGQRPEVSSEKARDDLKKGVKAVAFLSRLMGNTNRRKEPEVALDNVSTTSDAQLEGNEAEVFAQSTPTDDTGFTLRTTQPPDYIKVRSRYKERREFDHLFLAQELQCSKRRKLERTNSSRTLMRRKSSGPSEADTVWAMQFSRDGMHLAAAGADTVVRVWKVLSSLDDRKEQEKQESSNSRHLKTPVFQNQPVREYEGHEAPVLDLSWSKNNFLISSSMDKTVRLWHLSRAECLCTFKHNDFVPSIAFHPKDDMFFLAGSLDAKLRLWNISEKKVAFSTSVPDMITAVAFMPDGKQAVAGTLNGSCYWYETEGFKYKTQLQIRPDKGQGVSGPKITAIQAAQGRGGDKVLVTSNDSKIRLYNVRDKSCEMIFKGNVNDSSQIRGTLSDDGRYVVCGSEDRKAYVWSVTQAEMGKLDKKPVEFFDAHDSPTTSICIAPAKTRRLLAQSEDPIYDLAVSTSNALARTESHGSTKPPTELPSNSFNESETASLLNRSASILAKSGYKNGNIIVTADYAGKIKVFRQDCAWHKRQTDDGDRSSIFRRGDNNRSSLASSLQTKSSQKSLREAKNAAMAQVASSDRIMTWRQGIASTPTITQQPSQGSPQITAQSRDSSPTDLNGRGSHDETTSATGSPSTIPTSTGSVEKPALTSVDAAKDVFTEDEHRKASHDGTLCLEGDRSYMYWNKQAMIDKSSHAREMFSASLLNAVEPGSDKLTIGPALQHTISRVSQLSAEDPDRYEEDDSGDEHFDDATEQMDSR